MCLFIKNKRVYKSSQVHKIMLLDLPDTIIVRLLLYIHARNLLSARSTCSTLKNLVHETVKHTYPSKRKYLKRALSGLISMHKQPTFKYPETILVKAFLLSAHVDAGRVVEEYHKSGGPSKLVEAIDEWMFRRKFEAIHLLRNRDVQTGVTTRRLLFVSQYADHWVHTGTPVGVFMHRQTIIQTITADEQFYLKWPAVAVCNAFTIFGCPTSRCNISRWSVFDWIRIFKFLPLYATDEYTTGVLAEYNRKFDFLSDPSKHLYVRYGVAEALYSKNLTANALGQCGVGCIRSRNIVNVLWVAFDHIIQFCNMYTKRALRGTCSSVHTCLRDWCMNVMSNTLGGMKARDQAAFDACHAAAKHDECIADALTVWMLRKPHLFEITQRAAPIPQCLPNHIHRVVYAAHKQRVMRQYWDVHKAAELDFTIHCKRATIFANNIFDEMWTDTFNIHFPYTLVNDNEVD